jgi:DNA replication protein DnaC
MDDHLAKKELGGITLERMIAMEQDLGTYRGIIPPLLQIIYDVMADLGKTHLSSAIAKVVIDNGYDVVYETAQNIFADFEAERFGRAPAGENRTARYFNCDLLIMDDLGTEMQTQFTVPCLYNLLNTRLISEKSMIISTNVRKEELLSKYSDRITSRLFGEFEICVFTGKDIRSQKRIMQMRNV